VAIEYVGGAYAAGTSIVSVPAHQPGDLLIAMAAQRTNTVPTVPGGWSTMYSGYQTNASNYASCSVAAKVATSSSEAVSGFTGAESLTLVIYRGVACIGAKWARGHANSATITYPALTRLAGAALVDTWCVRMALHSGATNMLTNTPSGYTQRVGSASYVRAMDSNGPIAADSTVDTQAVNATNMFQAFTIYLHSPVDGVLPSASDVSDDFSSGILDEDVWSLVSDSGGILSVDDYVMGTNATSGTKVASVGTHMRLINDECSLQLRGDISAGTESASGYGIYPGYNSGVSWGAATVGFAHVKDTTTLRPSIGNTAWLGTAFTYTDGMWLRLRISGDGFGCTIYWEYSLDRESWTTAHTLSAGMFDAEVTTPVVASMSVRLYIKEYSGPFGFDNVNTEGLGGSSMFIPFFT